MDDHSTCASSAATTITPISVMTNALPSGHAARDDQTIHDALARRGPVRR